MIKLKNCLTIAIGIQFCIALLPAWAADVLIYEQSTLQTTDRGAYQYVDQQLADDFIPLVSENLTTITWQGSYYGTDNPNATESFTVQLFDDNAGLPPATPIYELVGLASKTASGTLLDKTLYDYSITVSGPVLNPGTTYWINLYSNEYPQNYAGANSTDGTTEGASRSGTGSWSDLDNNQRSNHVLALYSNNDTAPEPVPTLSQWSLVLIPILILFIGWFGMSRRKHQTTSF